MRSIFLMLPLLAASAGFAQTQPRVTIINSDGTGCPVGMSARQSGVGTTLWTVALEDQNRTAKQTALGMGVHVELKGTTASTIKQVKLAVRYLAAGTRFLPIETAGESDHHSKTFDLSAQNGASLKLAGDLLVGHVASILRIDLLSIDYTDGTSWHTSKGSSCSAKPSPFVLVSAH